MSRKISGNNFGKLRRKIKTLEMSHFHTQVQAMQHISILINLNVNIYSYMNWLDACNGVSVFRPVTGWHFCVMFSAHYTSFLLLWATFFSMFIANIWLRKDKLLVFSITCWYGDTALLPITTWPWQTKSHSIYFVRFTCSVTNYNIPHALPAESWQGLDVIIILTRAK